MSKRANYILVLVACSAIIGLIVLSAPRGKDKPSRRVSPQQEGPTPQAESPAPDEPTSIVADEPSGSLPDDPVPGPQLEAEALKQEAVRLASQLVEVFPEDAVTYALLGAAHHNSGDSDEATKWLRKCLELDPDRADAYGMLALIASKEGDFPQAAALCREALKRNPGMRDVQFRLGRTLMDLGELLVRLQQLDAAEQAYQKVTELSPERPEGHRALAEFYIRANRNLAKAQTFVERVVELQPSPPNFFLLAVACAQNQDLDRARVAMGRAVEPAPDNADYRQFYERLKKGQ